MPQARQQVAACVRDLADAVQLSEFRKHTILRRPFQARDRSVEVEYNPTLMTQDELKNLVSALSQALPQEPEMDTGDTRQ